MIKKPDVLSLLRCYSTIFNNTLQDYLNKHMSKDGIDHGGHTLEAATAEACKAVAQNQRDVCVKHYEPLIKEMYEALKGLCLAYNMDEQTIIIGSDPEYWERALKVLAKVEGE